MTTPIPRILLALEGRVEFVRFVNPFANGVRSGGVEPADNRTQQERERAANAKARAFFTAAIKRQNENKAST